MPASTKAAQALSGLAGISDALAPSRSPVSSKVSRTAVGTEKKKCRDRRDLDETAGRAHRPPSGWVLCWPAIDQRVVGRSGTPRRRIRPHERFRRRDCPVVGRGANGVVQGHERKNEAGRLPPQLRPGPAERESRREDDEQVNVDDGHEVGGVPVPVEWTEQPGAVRRSAGPSGHAPRRRRSTPAAARGRTRDPVDDRGLTSAARSTRDRHRRGRARRCPVGRVWGRDAIAGSYSAPPAVVTMSTSGALDASSSAAVEPRPTRGKAARPTVAPKTYA